MKKNEPKAPWVRPKPKMWEQVTDSVKTRSQKGEARLSKEIGFKLTPGSGNQCWPKGKGDGHLSSLMFELKETVGSSISVNASIVGKLHREASAVGRDPVFLLSAYGLPEPLPKDWVIITTALFEDMLRAYLEIHHGEVR